MPKAFIEDTFASVWIEEDILFVRYKQGVILSGDVAQKVFKCAVELTEGKPYPLLIDMSGVVRMEKEARDFFARERRKIVLKTAFLATTRVSKAICEFYASVNIIKDTTQVFPDVKQAVQYLKQ